MRHTYFAIVSDPHTGNIISAFFADSLTIAYSHTPPGAVLEPTVIFPKDTPHA